MTQLRLWEVWKEGILNTIDNMHSGKQAKDELIVFMPEEYDIGNFDYNELSKIESVKLVTGLFRDDQYVTPDTTEVFLIDKYFILHVLWEFQYGSYKYPKKSPSNLFCILNGRASWERACFMDKLHQRGLLENNIWTWNAPYEQYHQYTPESWKVEIKRLEHLMEPRHPPKETFRCVYNVAVESNPDASFITEKTYRPMLYRQMPLVFGPYKMYDFLKENGFKFPSIIDFSFDNEPIFGKRANILADEILRLSEKYTLAELMIENKKCTDHNYCNLLEIGKVYNPEILQQHEYYRLQREEIDKRLDYLSQYENL